MNVVERIRIKKRAEPIAPPRLLRSLPLAKQCIHLGTENPPEKPGCGSCSTWNCAIKGKVKLTHCTQECTVYPSTSNLKMASGDIVRNLIYHIYPVAGNGTWRWNVEQVCGRLKAFNGQKIVAIAIDPPTGRLRDPDGPNGPDRGREILGCDSSDAVKAEFKKHWVHDDITFLEFENDPALREVKTLIPMLSMVLDDDPNQITLYAQAKGTTRAKGHIARRWTETLYEIMFDHFPLAEEQLKTYPVTGCFKKLGAGWSPTQTHSDWHYSGSWHWVKNSELHQRDWQKIDQFWSGIEPYPSQQFKAVEAGCMFHTAKVPVMNLYDRRYWRTVVIPEFNKWREENAKYRTEMWPK